MKIFLFLGTLVWSLFILHPTTCGACPPRCTCTSIKNKADKNKDIVETPRVGQGKKVICSGAYSPISSVAEIRNLPLDTVILDLSRNTITILHRGEFNKLSGLKRLNLSNNQITLIEPNVFEGLQNLEKLDMSNNKIGSINSSIFTGLPKLQKLILSSNKFNTIPEGTFNPLISLRKIEFISDYLRCDCHLQWIVKWSHEKNVKIQSSTTCAVPSELKSRPLRKLKAEDLHCNRPLELPLFEISPSTSQVVFEGDKLPFECRASVIDRNTKMVWIRKEEIVETNRKRGIIVHTSESRDQSIMIHHLVLEELSKNDSGIWQCRVTSPQGNVTNNISIVVMPTTARFCPSFTTTTNKGVYKWPKTVAGVHSELPCKIGVDKLASHFCSPAGLWENLNVEACEYTDEKLRGLKSSGQKFDGNADDLARQLETLTSDPSLNRSPYFEVATGAIESLAAFIPTRQEIAERVLKIVSGMMNSSKTVLKHGQINDQACSRLVHVVESIPNQVTTRPQALASQNIGIYVMEVEASQFTGIKCNVASSFSTNVWCQQSFENFTDKNFFAKIGFVYLPKSLIRNNTEIALDDSVTFQFVAYKEPSLFPITVSPKDPLLQGKVLTAVSPVLTVNISTPIYNLTEPIVLTFKIRAKSKKLYSAYWNFEANDGLGEWNTDGCLLQSITNGSAVVHCYHLSSFVILEEHVADDLGLLKMLHLMKPAVYVGSCVCILCLMAVIVTYVSCFRFINVPKKMKHSVINICISSLLLIITFTMGVKRMDHYLACQIVGIFIHYLTLCAMFWVTITAYNLLKKFTKSDKPPAPPPDPVNMPLPPQPMLRFYLLGYGVPVIVCGITAAISLDHYADSNYCFLQWDPSLGAFYGPVALLVLFDVVFFLRIACVVQDIKPETINVITTDETHDIELNHTTDEITTEIEALTPVRMAQTKDMSDTQSTVSSVMDQEKRPKSQLYSVVGILLLYMLFWVCGAIAVAEPFKSWIPYQEDIFSYLYAFTCALFGIFMLSYFCLSRKDSCSSWKRFFLCDQPSVYDMEFHVPNQLDVPNGSVSKGTGESSVPLNHYNITQEENDKTFKDKSLISLVPVNSITDGSVVSVPENPQVFYNPKQNGAAKRFWEKRHHSKVITKDMFKNFSGSATDYFSGSEAGRPNKMCNGNLSDTNTHLSIEIQIQPKNGLNSKPTSPINFSPGMYCQPIPPPNGMPYQAPYFSLLPLHRNQIPPVGGSNVGSNMGYSSPGPGSQCCSVTSYPESQVTSTNRCPSSCSLGTKSHPSAFTPVHPKNNTLPKQSKGEKTYSPVQDMQRNGSVQRMRDFDGQSQITESCQSEEQRTMPSVNNLNCNNNKISRDCTYKQYGAIDDNIAQVQNPINIRRSLSGGSDHSARNHRNHDNFIQEVHQRIPNEPTSKQKSLSPPGYQSLSPPSYQSPPPTYNKTPNGDVLSPTDTKTLNGIIHSPDSDSQLQFRKFRGNDSDHNSEPASHSSYRRHHRRDHHHKRHSRHKGLPKPRSLDWDEEKNQSKIRAIPYVYVNHSYTERVKEKLISKGLIDRQTKSSNSINRYAEYGPMIEDDDSSTSSSDDNDYYGHDVWVLQGAKSKKSKKETSV
ncbi:adhesion G protein-coupled receptor A3-like [Mytilus californianus]|uniref:adhesion G protein-coupled receptor A3-like n=1 Tax=Mytilus californianus TaxID=6549 RepID=UPI002245B014|nr:adhesion G protein-coupled receptor A3-like [Mytilus californianus]